jgi:prevent-host-death family protein
METLSVSKFKATCLSVLEQVKTKKKKILITKRGVPIAEIVPVNGLNGKEKRVSLKGCVTFMGDIVSPVAEDEWEVQK